MSSSLGSTRRAAAGPGEPADLRVRISDLQGLLIVGMLMTGSTKETEVEDLCLGTVPALVPCDMAALGLRAEGSWRIRGEMDRGPLGGAVTESLRRAAEAGATHETVAAALPGFGWTSLHLLRSMNVDLGWLVVGSRPGPPHRDWARLLLQGLAVQTAASLLNARLHLAQEQRTLELQAIGEELKVVVARSNRHLAIHEELTAAAAEGGGVGAVVAALARVVGMPVVVEDARGTILAVEGEGEDPRGLPPGELQRIRYRLARERSAVQAARYVAYPVRSRGEFVASIWLSGRGRPAADETTPEALEHAAAVLAMELAHERRLAEVELRLRRDFTEELLEGSLAEDEGTAARARALNLDLGAPARVGVVVCPPEVPPGRVLDAVRGSPVLLATLKGGRVAVVVHQEFDWHRLTVELAGALGGQGPVIGLGSVSERLADYPVSYRQARRAADLAARTGGRLVRFEDLGVLRLLLGTENPSDLEDVTREWLQELLLYDRKHDAELVRTLGEYLDHGGNHVATARSLFIHVSTLKYRLQRIREISGFDLADPDVRFHMQLATRARRALEIIKGEDTQ
jgi:DNA-binding PucR family transcriptional regulator